MKVRIVRSINEELLDEAKEDDLIAKYSIGKGADKGNYDIHLFDFKKMLDWVHGAALKFAPGSTAKEMVANAKEITNTKDFVSKRKDRIKFLPWIMKMIAGGDSRKEVIDAASIFEKYSSQFRNRNLGSYKSPGQVVATYKEEVVSKRVAKARKERGKTEPRATESDRNIVYEDDTFFVVRPLTTDASCHYGRKTKWCISQEHNDYFREYTEDDGKIFYFIKDDRRKNDDPYYKVAIQIGLDSRNEPEIDGYWDRYDNPDDQVPLPIEDLDDKYREGEMEKILATIWDHAQDNPPEPGERGKLRELEESIFDGNWDTDYLDFRGEMDEYAGETPTILLSAGVSFKLKVKIFEDQDMEYVDEHWDDAMESGMGDALMEVLTYHEEFLSGYEEPTDIFALGTSGGMGMEDDEIRVSIDIPSQLSHSVEQAEAFMNTVQNTYGAEDIDDLTDQLTSIINKWMADRLNPGSLEKIKDVAKDIWNMNSKYKHMQAEYNEDDNEIYFAQKKMYTVPLKIPVFNQGLRGWNAENNVRKGIKAFRTEVRKQFEPKIKSAVETAMKEVDERASKFAQKQMTMYFKLKPSLRGVGVLPWRTTVHVAAFTDDQVRQKSAQEGLPTLKADINLELNKADDEEEIQFALQYVNFVDKYLPEIYELAMKKLDVDKYQKEINKLFMILVQATQFPEEEPVNENKRRIKVRIK